MLEIEKDTDFHAYGKAGNLKKKIASNTLFVWKLLYQRANESLKIYLKTPIFYLERIVRVTDSVQNL